MQYQVALLKSLPIIGASVLTPIVMRLWSRLSPPVSLGEFEDFHYLRRRNGWINSVFTLAMFCGLGIPFVLFRSNFNIIGWPALGIGFGGCVVLPWLWICAVTLPFGIHRYKEFWRYYELRYGVGLTGIAAVYVPMAFIGVGSVFELFLHGIW